MSPHTLHTLYSDYHHDATRGGNQSWVSAGRNPQFSHESRNTRNYPERLKIQNSKDIRGHHIKNQCNRTGVYRQALRVTWGSGVQNGGKWNNESSIG